MLVSVQTACPTNERVRTSTRVRQSVCAINCKSYFGWYRFLRSRSGVIVNVSQILNNVVKVIGRPASICCQCLAENPKLIMSSWL